VQAPINWPSVAIRLLKPFVGFFEVAGIKLDGLAHVLLVMGSSKNSRSLWRHSKDLDARSSEQDAALYPA
jgi:hypothetical protein